MMSNSDSTAAGILHAIAVTCAVTLTPAILIYAMTVNYESAIHVIARVYNKRREGEYPTLTILCTNALHKFRSVNH